MNQHDFEKKLAWSRGVARSTDAETIASLIPGCVSVDAANKEMDLRGIDFVATLRGGAKINIDIKARKPGVSANWKGEPELTLECYSVCPTENNPAGKAGWTLDESKLTDYVLYVFDPSDCQECFLLPFQLLRSAFRKYYKIWRRSFVVGFCESNGGPDNGGWRTESVFVPAWCVLEAIQSEMRQACPA